MLKTKLVRLIVTVVLFLSVPGIVSAAESNDDTFSQDEVLAAAERFFDGASEGLAVVVEKVFADMGQPNAYIAGEEFSGAIGVGLRYGRGQLVRKRGAGRKVFWQGPSIGFDFGGNASKTFVLVYNLDSTGSLFQRFPGVEGTYYFVGGVGVNYQQSGDIVLAPIRVGVGLRGGVNIGYLHYTPKHSWLPL